MSRPGASVASDWSGDQSLVIRAAGREARASALAAWRTDFKSLALSGFGHVATLAAMGCVSPVCASLAFSAAVPSATHSVRESVRSAGGLLPAPQPHSAGLPSADERGLPLAAERCAAPALTRRFAATRPRWRNSNGTPNQALQRTAPGVCSAPPRRPCGRASLGYVAPLHSACAARHANRPTTYQQLLWQACPLRAARHANRPTTYPLITTTARRPAPAAIPRTGCAALRRG
jgi:hypothetical protein